ENALQEYYRGISEDELYKINSNPTPEDLARVDKDGMVFERVFVDPQQLADLIAKSRPASAQQPTPPLQPTPQPTAITNPPPAASSQSAPNSSAAPANLEPSSETLSSVPGPGLQEVLLWHRLENDPRTHTRSLSGQEPFMIWLKAALIAGF